MAMEVMDEPEETSDENDHHSDVTIKKSVTEIYVTAQSWSSYKLTITSTLTGLLAIVLIFAYQYTQVGVTRQHPENLYKCIVSKQNAFPSQDPSIWADIPASLLGLIRDPSRPAVYLLLFEKEASNISSCIVELITTCANNFVFDNDKWLFLNGSKLSTTRSKDSAGALIETLSREMNEHSKVVIVTDIQKVPAKLAHGFHFLIDEFNPTVKDAVYIFTLTTDELGSNSIPFEIAQDELNKSWKELDSSDLQPLVTRFTVVVLPVKQEEGTRSCPLKIGSTIEIIEME